MEQPVGVADRRPIADDVIKNICKLAPMCEAQGIISKESLAYMLGWCEKTLPRTPRPVAYTCLKFRQKTSIAYTRDPVIPMWAAPARFTVFDLKGDTTDDNDDDDVTDDMPIAFE